MSRVLLIGYNPPPCVRDAKIEAAHYRTFQFLQPLLDDGHVLCLCAGSRDEPDGRLPAAWAERVQYHPIAPGRRGWRARLQAAHDEFRPDCIVAVNFSHCLYATALRTERPLWMDIYGDILTIMQAAAFRAGSDRGVATTMAFMRQVLRAADVLSACGTPQRHALVGELAMCGRLNRHTFGYEFAHVVLPGAVALGPGRPRPVNRQRSHLAPHGIGTDDFVVLWCGGYNTWTDVDTLFRGIEMAMTRDPRVHYVSLGASTYLAPDSTYDRLLGLVAASPRRAQFHMLGWRPWSDIVPFYEESDVGVNIDAQHYETTYGTRTRLVEMIAAGLPVITSVGTELSSLLRERGAALTFEIGDWRGLAEQVLALAGDQGLGHRLAETAFAYAEQTLSFASTTAPLRAWVQRPTRAPDKLRQNRTPLRQAFAHRLRTAVRLTLWRVADRDR